MANARKPNALKRQLTAWFGILPPDGLSPSMTRLVLGMAADLLSHAPRTKKEQWQKRFTTLVVAETFPNLPGPLFRSDDSELDMAVFRKMREDAPALVQKVLDEIGKNLLGRPGRPSDAQTHATYLIVSWAFTRWWHSRGEEGRTKMVRELGEIVCGRSLEKGEVWAVIQASARRLRKPEAAARELIALKGEIDADALRLRLYRRKKGARTK